MITQLKRNDLKWALPFAFRKQNEMLNIDALALEIVNSKERVFKINGLTVISQNIEDLEYIYSFSNVRIKLMFINSVKFHYIDYASNYDITYKKGNEHDFIDFDMLLLGFKTLEDVKRFNDKYITDYDKRETRRQNKKTNDVIKEKRMKLASKLLNDKINKYQTMKTADGKTFYISDGVLYTLRDLKISKHHALYTASISGRLSVRA